MRISDWSSDVCSSDLSLFDYEPRNATASISPDELVDEFVALYRSRSNRRQHYAARHLLCWLRLRKIAVADVDSRSEEHTYELQYLMRISYVVFCLKKKQRKHSNTRTNM